MDELTYLGGSRLQDARGSTGVERHVASRGGAGQRRAVAADHAVPHVRRQARRCLHVEQRPGELPGDNLERLTSFSDRG